MIHGRLLFNLFLCIETGPWERVLCTKSLRNDYTSFMSMGRRYYGRSFWWTVRLYLCPSSKGCRVRSRQTQKGHSGWSILTLLLKSGVRNFVMVYFDQPHLYSERETRDFRIGFLVFVLHPEKIRWLKSPITTCRNLLMLSTNLLNESYHLLLFIIGHCDHLLL